MRGLILIIALVSTGILSVQAQTPATVKPEEQARVKPLVEALNKANEPLLAKRASLPESKVVSDAQAALQKAVDAQMAAVQKLPEFEAVKSAETKLLDEVYRIMANHGLSSREFRPAFTDKGELTFARTEKQP